jgi:hypothetical protein
MQDIHLIIYTYVIQYYQEGSRFMRQIRTMLCGLRLKPDVRCVQMAPETHQSSPNCERQTPCAHSGHRSISHHTIGRFVATPLWIFLDVVS